MRNSTIIYFHTDRSILDLVEVFLMYEDGTMHPNESGNGIKLDFGPVKFLFSRNHLREMHGENVGDFPGGFLSFKYMVVVVWEDLKYKPNAVALARELISFFWNQNIPAVATGKLEPLLPNAGGYNCENLPWPNKKTEE